MQAAPLNAKNVIILFVFLKNAQRGESAVDISFPRQFDALHSHCRITMSRAIDEAELVAADASPPIPLYFIQSSLGHDAVSLRLNLMGFNKLRRGGIVEVRNGGTKHVILARAATDRLMIFRQWAACEDEKARKAIIDDLIADFDMRQLNTLAEEAEAFGLTEIERQLSQRLVDLVITVPPHKIAETLERPSGELFAP